jgi:hypothetical protein
MAELWFPNMAVTELECRLQKLTFKNEKDRRVFEKQLAESMLRFQRRNHAFLRDHAGKGAVKFLAQFLKYIKPHYKSQCAWTQAQELVSEALLLRGAQHCRKKFFELSDP